MPPKDLFIIAQVYRCCQYIILGDGRYKGAAPKRPDRRGQIAAMRQLCCRSCVSCRSKVILRRYKGSSKSKDREAPPQTALREGAELNSPSNMFHLMVPRLGKAERLSPSLRQKPHGKDSTKRFQWEKVWRRPHGLLACRLWRPWPSATP